MDSERSAAEQRMIRRLPIETTGVLVHRREHRRMAISDISEAGLRAKVEAVLRRGERVIVYLPDVGGRSATVRWIRAGQVGMRFDQPIDLRRLGLAG